MSRRWPGRKQRERGMPESGWTTGGRGGAKETVPPCSRASSSRSWGPGGLLAGVGRTDDEVGALGKEHIGLSDEERYISVMHAPGGSHGLGARHGAMDGDMMSAASPTRNWAASLLSSPRGQTRGEICESSSHIRTSTFPLRLPRPLQLLLPHATLKPSSVSDPARIPIRHININPDRCGLHLRVQNT